MYLTFQITKYLTLTIALGLPVASQQETSETPRAPTLESPAELTPSEPTPPNPPASVSSPSSVPATEAKPNSPPTPAVAESVPADSYSVLASDSEKAASKPESSQSSNASEDTLNSKKLLNDETPEWVKQGVVLGDEHRLAICSSLLPDLEQCREDLRTRLLGEVQAYLDKHVLTEILADELPELTQEYVEKYWVNPSQSFDNVQDRPSGTYHQLWIGLQISADQLEKVRSWEAEALRHLRVRQLGVISGVGIAGITMFSGLVGVLARREKAKLKK